LNEFHSPQELWERYKTWKQIQPEREKIITQPYSIGDKPLCYYQQVAMAPTNAA
jgi:type I restriction enzyme R subunit